MKKLTPGKSNKFWDKKLLKTLVFVIILGFYASFLVVKIGLTATDNDAGLYISDGKVIWETQKVFRNNIYSYTEPEHPVYDHHWMSSVSFYLISETFGFEGLTIFKTAILLLAFSVLFLASTKKADFWLVAVLSLPTILILSARNRIRPEMFSYLFLALFIYLLFDFEKNPERKRIFWLIPLQLLWVNFHIFFFVGVALVGGFLFERIILNFRGFWRDPAVKKLFFILLILAGVCFVNPNGIEGALAPFKSHSYSSFVVTENQPLFNLKASFLTWNLFGSTFGLMVSLFLFSFIFGFRGPSFAKASEGKQKPFNSVQGKPIFFLLAGIGSAAAGLMHVRLLTLFAVMFLPAVSSNFSGVLLVIKDRLKRKWPKSALVLGYSLALIILATFPYKAYEINTSLASRGYPTDWGIGLDSSTNDSAKFFKENNLRGPIFNDYDIGGYIIYHLFPEEKVFVDNNGADSYPIAFFDDIFMPALSWDDRWQEAEKKYGINAIFISMRDGSPVVASFIWRRLHDPSWSLVYVDKYAIILVKNIPQNKDIIEKFGITKENVKEKTGHLLESDDIVAKLIGGRLLYLIGREDLSTSIFKKVVSQHPKNSWAWLYMGSIKVHNNDAPSLISAIIFLENAVNMGEKTSEGYTWLGLAYFKSGQFKKSEKTFQEALRLDPGRYDTTNYLSQLQQYLTPEENPDEEYKKRLFE